LEKNRRNFFKLTGLAGLGLAGSSFMKGFGAVSDNYFRSDDHQAAGAFNMSGYGAPKLDTVRVGFIGLGNRGPTHLGHADKIENVEVTALCDLRPEKVEKAKGLIKSKSDNLKVYSGSEDAWKNLCQQKDIDLIYIATPWHLHAPMAIYAMKQGKHVAIEVPCAVTLEECWDLVKTSESTRKHCVILENCCYDFFELLTLNMARQGFFGEIIHAEGAYLHDLLKSNFSKQKYYHMWRLTQNLRNGNLYPTHGLGPVAQIMNINCGDKMEFLVSVSSKDFMKGPMANELAEKDDEFKPFANKKFGGNINTTIISTNKGRTIMLQHDVTSPNVYSRIHKVSGSKASALKYPLPAKISVGDDWATPEELQALEEKYTPPIVKKIGAMAKEVGGHGGMDFLMNWRLIDCLRHGIATDLNVYDAALWSAIAPLTEKSVAGGSNSVKIPDFTKGWWKTNEPVDVFLQKGGDTRIKV